MLSCIQVGVRGPQNLSCIRDGNKVSQKRRFHQLPMSWDILKIISVIYIVKNEGWVCSRGRGSRSMRLIFLLIPSST